MTRSLIVIPARYGSTRLPGKPLVDIAGKTLLQRVAEIGTAAAKQFQHTEVVVATDDKRIMDHAKHLGVHAVMTPENCPTGTDRTYHATMQYAPDAEFIITLQGDAPLTPPAFITALLDCLQSNEKADMVTPVTQLSWSALSTFRQQKQSTPQSGTTAIIDPQGRALWFSKHILPAIRNEAKLTETLALSPVFKHMGVYGYRANMLKTLIDLPQSHYEILEGLEQLRAIENGYAIYAVKVNSQQYPLLPGVDTQQDVERVAALITEYGEMSL